MGLLGMSWRWAPARQLRIQRGAQTIPASVSRVRAAVTRQEYQCRNFQFQAIASAASSSSAPISSGSKAIGTHARFKAGVSQHTRSPNAQLQNTKVRLRVDCPWGSTSDSAHAGAHPSAAL